MSGSSIRSQLNRAIQNVIPGLQTMDPPPDADGPNSSNQDMIVIDMPAADGRMGGGPGGLPPPVGGIPQQQQQQDTDGEREQRQGRSITDSNIARYLSEGCAELILFILILAGKLAYDHRLGLTVFLGLVGTFIHHNSSVKKEIEQKEKRNIPSLIMRLVLLLMNIFFIYYVLEEQHLYRCLIFMKPNIEEMNLWSVFWCVGITDFVIKYSTLMCKCLVTLLPGSVLGFKKRGKLYLAIEQVSQLYRMLPPVPLWLRYISDDTDSHWVISYFLTVAYIILKVFTIYRKQKELRKSLQNVFTEVQYGITPSEDQMRRVGEACPICQDAFQDPIQLTCKHIFCEDCVAMWFDRERTCPMCRAQIAASPAWRDGSTAMSIQVF